MRVKLFVSVLVLALSVAMAAPAVAAPTGAPSGTSAAAGVPYPMFHLNDPVTRPYVAGEAVRRGEALIDVYWYFYEDVDFEPTCSARPFPDVPVSHTYCYEIADMKMRGLVTGKNGLFRPDGTVSRGEFAAYLWRLHADWQFPDQPSTQDQTCSGTTRTFSDVPATSGLCNEIEALARRGILRGSGGKFFPEAPLVAGAEVRVWQAALAIGFR